MSFRNYDSWKLSSPYDDEVETPEVYETEKYGFFHTDESLLNEFDSKVKKFNFLKVPDCYVSREEYHEELAANLADDLGLYDSPEQCLIELEQNERDEYEAAMEQKAEWNREMQRLHKKGWL